MLPATAEAPQSFGQGRLSSTQVGHGKQTGAMILDEVDPLSLTTRMDATTDRDLTDDAMLLELVATLTSTRAAERSSPVT